MNQKQITNLVANANQCDCFNTFVIKHYAHESYIFSGFYDGTEVFTARPMSINGNGLGVRKFLSLSSAKAWITRKVNAHLKLESLKLKNELRAISQSL